MAPVTRSGTTIIDSGGLIVTPTTIPETTTETVRAPSIALFTTITPAPTPTPPVVVLPPLLIPTRISATGETLGTARDIVSEEITTETDSNPVLLSTTDIMSEKEFWPFYQKAFLTSLIGTEVNKQEYANSLKNEYQIQYEKLNETLKERRTAKAIIDNINFALDIKTNRNAVTLINKFLGYSEDEFNQYSETKMYYELLSSIRRNIEGSSAILVGEEQTSRIQSRELISNQRNNRNLSTIKKIVPLKRNVFEDVGRITAGLTNDKIIRLTTLLLSRELSVSKVLSLSNIKTLLREKYTAASDNNPFDNLFGDQPSSVFGLPRGEKSLASKINFRLSTNQIVQVLESTYLNKKTNPTIIPGSVYFRSNIIDGDPSIENLLRFKSSFSEVVDDIALIFKEITGIQTLSPEFLFSRATTAFTNSLNLLRIEDAISTQRLLFALIIFSLDNPEIKQALFQLFLLVGIKSIGPTATESSIFKNIGTEIGQAKNILGSPPSMRENISIDNIDLVARNLGQYIENKINEIFEVKNSTLNPSVYRPSSIVLTPGSVARLVEYSVSSTAQNIFSTFAEFLTDSDIASASGLGVSSYFLGTDYGREGTYTKFNNVSSMTIAFIVFEMACAFTSKYVEIELAKHDSNLIINEPENQNIILQERLSSWVAGNVSADSELTKSNKALKDENGFLETFAQLNNDIVNNLTKSANDFNNFISKGTGRETVNNFYKSIISEQYEIIALLKQRTEVIKNIIPETITQINKNYIQLLKNENISLKEQAIIIGVPTGFIEFEKRNIPLNFSEDRVRKFGDFIKFAPTKNNALNGTTKVEKQVSFDMKLTINLPVDLDTFSLRPNGLLDFLTTRATFNRSARKNMSFTEYKNYIKTTFGMTNAEEIIQNHFISDVLLGFYSCVLSIPSGINELTFVRNKKFKQTPMIPRDFQKEYRSTRPELFIENDTILPEVKFDRIFAINCAKTKQEVSTIETIYVKLNMVG